MKRLTKITKPVEIPAASATPPIQAALIPWTSAFTNRRMVYARSSPHIITLLLHQHLSKKLLNWNTHEATIQTALQAAKTFPTRRSAIDDQRAIEGRESERDRDVVVT